MSDFTGIRVNNLGFLPSSSKVFTILNPPSMEFEVQTIGPDVEWTTVFRGTMVLKKEGIAHGDFSTVTTPADYRILIRDPKAEKPLCSEPFIVKDHPWDPAMRMILEGVRWQRCGSPEGWGGCCHQAPVPLKHGLEDTGKRLDVRGGYHQSGDVRCWADGISGAFLAFLRAFSVLKGEWVNRAKLEEELAWCASYFLKVTSPEGMVYDCQFVPIGWGPRDYYDTPAPMTAHCNISRILAGVSDWCRTTRPEFAARCLETALRIAAFVEDPAHFTEAYVPPVPDLPRGTQGVKFYRQEYRTSARGIAARCAMMLDLFRSTGEKRFRETAERLSDELLALQVKEGPSAGLFREAEGKNTPGCCSCAYGMILSGPAVLTSLITVLPDSPRIPQWKRAAEGYARMLLNRFREAERRYIPTADPAVPLDQGPAVIKGNGVATGARDALFLLDSGFFPAEAEKIAQSVMDFYLGQNSRGVSYVNGIGWRHETANIYGQFFPSTPPIPGGTCHVLSGEYDMPAAAMLFLLMAVMTRSA